MRLYLDLKKDEFFLVERLDHYRKKLIDMNYKRDGHIFSKEDISVITSYVGGLVEIREDSIKVHKSENVIRVDMLGEDLEELVRISLLVFRPNITKISDETGRSLDSRPLTLRNS